MAGINAPDGRPYMPATDMAAMEAQSSLSSVLPWGGKYPPGVGVAQRKGFDIVTPEGLQLHDLHQRILSYSMGGHADEINAAVNASRIRFPNATLVDTTEYFEPATLFMQALHEALGPYGDFLLQLATTGTGANEQAIRLAMGSLGGEKSSRLLALSENYGGCGLQMNAICDAEGWKGDTSLKSNARHVNIDGSNLDKVFAACVNAGEKPILIMEDGIQGVGGFKLLDIAFLRELAERISDAGGRKIYDNVQALVRATGGKGLFGFNRWADPKNPKHLPDFVTFAKGIGDGQAMAGLAVRRDVAEQVKAAPGGAGNTFDTFNRGRDALVTAGKVLEITQGEKLWENVHARGHQFQGNLRPMLDKYPGVVRDVVGIGGMTGLEFRDPSKLVHGMRIAPEFGIVVAKGGSARNPVMRLPLQFDTPAAFVESVSDCIEYMLKTVQLETGA
ncbi:hypothetical protein COY05_05050 [Candidatus Peregrinibacteria bacterium CG_4_10_14_0_2_um_filter_38_24]|nr:MAG: hypothetical protein COY05_05050 [Candidatus Peregrinibacteria bacterium CG_4_10_14_0_2_um_filter_38_24]